MGKVEINQNKTQHLLTIEMLPSYRQLLLVNNMKELLKSLPRQTGLLSFNYICPLITIYNQEILLENGNFNEGARNLYTALHQLDNLKLARIITAQLLNIGIGIAVNNRL